MSRPRKLIQFYLTNLCNSHCKTCSIWKNDKQMEIPLRKVINIIESYPFADFVFGGGEFTLYSQKDELLDYCDSHNVNYTVLSNAVNIKLLVDLIEKHEIENLTISCDGIRHDSIRGVEGNLSNIKYIIETYREKIPNIKVSYTLSKFNANCKDLDMEMFKELGFDKVYFCIAQDMDLLKVRGESVEPDEMAIKSFYDKHYDMLYDKDRQLLYDMIRNRLRTCDSTQSVHTIYTNGDVVRCQSHMSNNVIGNIFDTDFSELLKGDAEGWKYNVEVLKEHCPYEETCKLVCQRRYDYEDRI